MLVRGGIWVGRDWVPRIKCLSVESARKWWYRWVLLAGALASRMVGDLPLVRGDEREGMVSSSEYLWCWIRVKEKGPGNWR